MLKCRSIFLLILCFYFVGCSEESVENPPQNDSNSQSDNGDNGTSDGNGDNGPSEDTPTGTCGNGQLEANEECDNGENNSDTLADACRTNCKNASCGDGVTDDEGLNEQCDDGNLIDDDGCNNLCRLASCGDGVVQSGEACDDGSNNSDTLADTCRLSCTLARCGDSVTDSNEDCDDGNNLSNDACIDCVSARCGDGLIRQNIETCDDQNAFSLDGCSDQCRVEFGFDCQGEPSTCDSTCGDGSLASNETCDDQNTQNGDYCNADCTAIIGRCGDGITQSNEVCDDGNIQNNDDCANNCLAIAGFCGDGQVQSNEVCDDNNNLNGDYCAADCQSNTGSCGDGVTQSNESCDDGNAAAADYCSPNCAQITGSCGDTVQQNNESCDDGNALNGDYCSYDCQTITGFCGDTIVQSNEQCDDGNTTVGDYCNNNCNISGFCGDGILQSPAQEVCDDGNLSNADGCAASCVIEPGWNCSGTPTNCVPVFCAANQRVQNNVCVGCSPGTSNDAGDNASGEDTLCDILCAVDERVQNNTCVPCDVGMINAAGDNASGPDTTCDDEPCYVVFGLLCPEFEQAYIKASNTDPNDNFGYSVALEGDTLVVGAMEEDSNATGIGGNQTNNFAASSGAVYVFVRSGTTWTQQAYIKASNAEASDFFGWSVALSGDTLAVGAYGEDSNATGIDGDQADNSAPISGAVYVFTRSGTTWTQQAYIKASNTEGGDNFGRSLALLGDTLAVGAYGEDSNSSIDGDQANNSLSESGAVYVFVRSGTTWTQQSYIKASNTDVNDNFGRAIALDTDTLAVGARAEDSNATGVDGNQTDNSATNSGAVYVFVRSGTTWTQQAYIKASNTDPTDNFGVSVAISGDTLAIGAYGEDSSTTGINGNQFDNSAQWSGSVYVFVRSGTTWTQQAYIKASNTGVNDFFGWWVALEGHTLVVGARGEASTATGINGDQADDSASESGAVYVFVRSDTTWTQQAYIKASNTNQSDFFSYSFAISGDTLAIGAYGEDSNALGINGNQADNAATNSGAVYVRKIAIFSP